MKKNIMILLVLVFSFSMVAGYNYSYLPLAGTDDILAAKINPAALAFGNSSGLGILLYNDEDFNFVRDELSLIFNFKHLGYTYDKNPCYDAHSLYSSWAIARNIYTGLNYRWVNSRFKSGDYELSALIRPFDFISLGVRAWQLDVNDPELKLGASFRPFPVSGKFWDRLSLNCDFDYFGKEWSKPILGIQTEFLDGFYLGGGYDLEAEAMGLNFSLAFDKIRIGSLAGLNPDQKIKNGISYFSINSLSYRSFLKKDHQNDLYAFSLTGEIVEKKPVMELGPFTIISDDKTTLSETIKKIKKYQEDKEVDGILFKNVNFSASFAQYMELKNALQEFKSEGKKVYFYFNSITNLNYVFAASIADAIYLHPMGEIQLKGISISLPYVKELLDTLGVEIVNLRSHDYKTAGNILSETEMTSAEKESYDYILDGLYNEMIAMVEKGRKNRLSKPFNEIIDQGPYFIAKKAHESGLVDGLIYEDQLESELKGQLTDLKIHEHYSDNRIRYDWSDPAQDRVALIYAVGNIHMGKGKPGSSIGEKTMAKAIREAREDNSIKGIIIRVDSGGGSALASDIIAREIELCRESDYKKPVIVSMSGVAGSGGYFISAPADLIIAQPVTITGSIGVVGIMANLKRLYDKVLINWSTLKRGKHADIGSSKRAMTAEEMQMLETAINDCYHRFVSLVADFRGMSYDDVHRIAQGRIWTGKQALERGLVDRLGGMDLALNEMKRLAGLKREVELVEFDGRDKGYLNITLAYETSLLKLFGIPRSFNNLYEVAQKIEQLSSERILMVLPHDLEIE